MATITNLTADNTFPESWPILNENFDNLNDELTSHAASHRAGSTDPLVPALVALTYAATVDLAFTADPQRRSLAMAGNLTFTGSGYADGYEMQIFMAGDSVTRTIAVPGAWVPIGEVVTELAANKNAVLSLQCISDVASGVRYAWGVQP